MKKILSTVVALGLVAGFAATASALDLPDKSGPATGYDRTKDTPTAPGVDLFSVKGSYSLAGAMQSDGLGAGSGVQLRGGTGNEDNGTDAFYFHSFITDMTMNVGDKIAVHSQLRFADRDVWGLNDANQYGVSNTAVGPNNTGLAGAGAGHTHTYSDNTASFSDSGRIIDVRQIYMDYDSPIGKWRVGRVPVAAWYGSFINSGSQGNRIMYWPNFIPKPFSVLLFTQKISEGDVTNNGSDGDTDGYYAGIEHKMDMGTTALAYFHVRGADNNSDNIGPGNAGTNTETTDSQNIWGYGKYNVAMLTIEGEFSYNFGDASSSTTATTGKDRDAWAAMLDVSGKIGSLNIGALYFMATGDNDNTDGDREDFMGLNDGTGDDFNPYHILTGDWTGILNNDKARNPSYTQVARAGVQSLGVHAAFPVTPKLTISGAIGAAWADEEPTGYDDEYGVEYDLNVAYKLLDNLTYSAHFGYLSTGDFFKEGTTYTDTNDITFLANQISMNF